MNERKRRLRDQRTADEAVVRNTAACLVAPDTGPDMLPGPVRSGQLHEVLTVLADHWDTMPADLQVGHTAGVRPAVDRGAVGVGDVVLSVGGGVDPGQRVELGDVVQLVPSYRLSSGPR